MKVLFVLMWHHLMVRKRRYFVTLFEFLVPVFMFLLLYLLRKSLLQEVPAPTKYITGPAELSLHDKDQALRTRNPQSALSLILYTPPTRLTDVLMNKVAKKLGLRRLYYVPDPTSRGVYGCHDISLMSVIKLTQQMNDRVAVVSFEDMYEDEYPLNLNCTIRMNMDFYTDAFTYLDYWTDGTVRLGLRGLPSKRFGAINEPLLRLQWAIDTSFIELRTNQPIGLDVHLQEVPLAAKKNISYMPSDNLSMHSLFGLFMSNYLIMTRVIEYRSTGLEELLKMVGVTPTLLKLSHFLNMFPGGLVYSTAGACITTMTTPQMCPKTKAIIIFMALILFFSVMMFVAFATSFITNSSSHGSIVAQLSIIVWYILSELLFVAYEHVPTSVKILFAFFPNIPNKIFWYDVEFFEKKGVGVTFNNMFVTPDEGKGVSVGVVLILLIIQLFLLFGIVWYLSKVRPGSYGVALPFNFLCKRSYWHKMSEDEELGLSEHTEPVVKNPTLFEPIDHVAEVGLRIIDVSKVYGKKVVLSHVTFDAYKGEITLLLGHNGAGKTTLISIITGMTKMTTGSVFVNGLSLATHPERVRRDIGYCPQHNLVVPNLSLHQQVVFFAMLKGEGYSSAQTSAKELLAELGLEKKMHNDAHQLSGGMKRRLQLACALAGGSSVVILDEPTSGMDVETRRELWNLLLSLRGNHTVLLTTHYMEEADVLGDRAVALHGGVLQCYGTPMFLKKGIGSGYRLSLTTTGLPQEEAITRAITSVVPQAVVREKGYNSITYVLPSQESGKFPALFSLLENQRTALNIDSIGVGLSTLEDVFLKLCSDVSTEFTEEQIDINLPESAHYQRKKGLAYYLIVMLLLILRQILYMVHNKWTFLFLVSVSPTSCTYLIEQKCHLLLRQLRGSHVFAHCVLIGCPKSVLIPVVIIAAFTETTTQMSEFIDKKATEDIKKNPSSLMKHPTDLELFDGVANKRVLYQGVQRKGLRTWEDKAIAVEVTQGNENSEVLNATLRTRSDNKKDIGGIELKKKHAKIWYRSEMRHAAPVALNTLSNILATRTTPYSSITTYYEPLTNKDELPKTPLHFISLMMWVTIVGVVFLSALNNAMGLPMEERHLGTRHIHLMAGCPPPLHWLATFIAHILVFTVCLTVPILLITLMDTHETIKEAKFVGVLCAILTLGATSWLAMSYFIHFIFGSTATKFVLVVLSTVGATAATTYILLKLILKPWMDILFKIVHYTLPSTSFVSAFLSSVAIASTNALRSRNKDFCTKNPTKLLCAIEVKCYLCSFDKDKPTIMMMVMICQTIFFMTLVQMFEYGLLGGLWEKVKGCNYKPDQHRFNDPIVTAEKAYVDETIDLKADDIPDAMLVSDLHKKYVNACAFRVFTAVKGINFSIKKGECFGLLGVNGAGKSSTFKMITAEAPPTRGRCFANSHFLRSQRIAYMRSLSYCPQFFGMDEFMTGRQNLKLILQMCGVPAKEINSEIEAWLAVAGLERYANVRVSAYSGGCARRLAATSALASGSAVTLLDEPTAGVDVAARRRVWLAIRRGMRNHRSIVLTSHSMDEMEALCSRIAIMTGGEFAALGSAPALRAAHAKGFAIAIKVAPRPSDAKDVDHLIPLKKAIEEKYSCKLTDSHETMVHYHIADTVKYSDLFQFMEDLKKSFPGLIEDYTLSETTLEEAFLSFAHPQKDDKPPAPSQRPT